MGEKAPPFTSYHRRTSLSWSTGEHFSPSYSPGIMTWRVKSFSYLSRKRVNSFLLVVETPLPPPMANLSHVYDLLGDKGTFIITSSTSASTCGPSHLGDQKTAKLEGNKEVTPQALPDDWVEKSTTIRRQRRHRLSHHYPYKVQPRREDRLRGLLLFP